MSDNFFTDLNLPKPHIALEVGSGTHAEQTGKTMIAYEKICFEQRPDITLVVGDVNATVACALVCAKLGIKLVHLEAGLRSFDRSMPEEINRIVTDSLSDLCLTPSADGDENLIREGIAPARIKMVGNIMIDSLQMLLPRISEQKLPEAIKEILDNYAVLTLHRPSNVDDKEKLSSVIDSIVAVSDLLPLVFPVHPRTRKQLESFGLMQVLENNPRIHLLQPLGYNQFMALVCKAKAVITDSGGIQEETSYLGIPCFTLRENTERPVTVNLGSNLLTNERKLYGLVAKVISSERKLSAQIPLWDGRTAQRVAEVLFDF